MGDGGNEAFLSRVPSYVNIAVARDRGERLLLALTVDGEFIQFFGNSLC